ncbi:UDP-N-acetylmuramate--L-alanine ligase [Candidatus Magnetomonas plexicatena]|uniref:UDP-N-acetylmuramate--L-alanine ligase n=1 Tax=Candidatus Magnetomonas plexicatena TaxID=2552947 RepID=UPI001C773938|nr:UDP-N-acetylmuramate--L-alanine ligase [Nitrospirales bacterium LBB_01]
MLNRYRVIHFVGIGGIGMSGIARVLKRLNYDVTGSDLKSSATTDVLISEGIKVYIGHKAENVDSAHVVVVTSAVNGANPEVEEAKRRSIPVIPRAEMLAEIGRLKYGILVAGSHGKTTTTSLLAGILIKAGSDPTVVLGGKLNDTNSNSRVGKGEFFVAEADESDGSFLKLNPTVAICTNIDREHMDFYSNMENLKSAYVNFLNKVPFYGLGVVCADDPNIRDILPDVNRKYVTYGLTEAADFSAHNIKYSFQKTEFEVISAGISAGTFTINLSGKHNVLNTLAAIAAASFLNIPHAVSSAALAAFSGIKRRMEFKGHKAGVRVFDDYGHHPTEIKATISGIKHHVDKRLLIVFQPHRYSRTADLMDEFSGCFTEASRLYLLDIYPAGEKPIEGATSHTLAERLRARGVDVVYVGKGDGLSDTLRKEAAEGDTLVTFGAGDVWKVGEEFVGQG